MTIPQTKDFEELLRSLSLNTAEPEGTFGSVVAVDEQILTESTPTMREFLRGAAGVGYRARAVSLWFRTDGPLSFEAVQRKVNAELNRGGLAHSAEATLAFLATFAEVRSEVLPAVQQLNDLLQCLVETSVTQFVALPGVPVENFRLRLPQFTLGRLDWQRLSTLCERVGTDFHRRYGAQLENRFGLERKKFQIKVLDWATYGARRLTKASRELMAPGSLGYYLIDQYYAAIGHSQITAFWEALRDDQDLLLSAGAPYVDERVLRELPTNQFVTIFAWLSATPPHGWVSPFVSSTLRLELGASDQKVRALTERLRDEFDVADASPASQHPSVRNYSRLLARAERHKHDRRVDEAFVHFVIALDLLLGSPEGSSKSVSERAAVVYSRASGVKFGEALRQLRTLYDSRSKYVHEGETVPADLLGRAEQVCREVLFALLRFASRDGRFRPEHLSTKWHRELDLLVANLNAGRDVSDKDWENAGILSTGPRSRP